MNIGQDKTVEELLSRLAGSEVGPVKACGTWGSFAPLLTSYISDKLRRPILYIASHIDDAENAADDLHIFSKSPVETLCAWAGDDPIDATDEIGSSRIRLSYMVSCGGSEVPSIITASSQSLIQPVSSFETISAGSLYLAAGSIVEMELVRGWLVDNAFEEVDRVDVPGQYSVRGGIVDIFAPVTSFGRDAVPIRVEFFGDSIESIRRVDLDTQLSAGAIEKVTIVSPIDNQQCGSRTIFTDLLSDDTIVIVAEPAEVQESVELFLRRVSNPDSFYKWADVYKSLARFKKLYLSRFAADSDYDLDLRIKSTQRFEHKQGPLWAHHRSVLDELCHESAEGKKVFLYCANSAECDRVSEILSEGGRALPENFELISGFLDRGFIIDSLGIIVVTHHELFGQYAVKRKPRPVSAMRSVDAFSQLERGDYVVHISYGIGKYKGVKVIEREGQRSEFLSLEYGDKAIIHVPVGNIHLVQKYIGTAGVRPALSRIGTKKWERQKKLVSEAVAELASELLEVQAKRQSVEGICFGSDTKWQKEFEESFLYQETPDQITSLSQIKFDMQRPVPMDRLLCGDVGYGKTELAMRAAFKAVENGVQVAVLVPTTVLCVQHGNTFTERFADFPIVIETLNRFKTRSQAADILSRAKQGKVDILIGTHRLLSSDVGFKNLGLLVIDEEQRFGVAHKERLKKMRVNVEVLTMTATPIPRTLHMALLGLRDISSLATAPLDRRAVVTRVKRYDKDLIRSAIHFELNRQGQIFFLHNRVESIEKCAAEIGGLVPDASLVVAHGQMPKHKLEKAMIDFVMGKVDVMVCSTIIESGIDVPNANTIIINDADRFGLAQLHQLRGRVGRFKNRAYAYMLLPRGRPVSPVGVKRLKSIEEYSQLGAGFKIALRDLEIRGAGNILGSEQSGHINTVGYELFCGLLSEAVARLKKEPVHKEPMTVIELGFPKYIPRNYISSDSQRLNVYRRIATSKSPEDMKLLREELQDFFGSVCDEVERLLDVGEVRILASRHGIKFITRRGNDLVFGFEPQAVDSASDLFARVGVDVVIVDGSTVHLRLTERYFEDGTLLSFLRKILRKRSGFKL